MDPISPKVELCVVARTADSDDAVAAKVWSVEVRVVGDVEDLRAELEGCAFFDGEVFEDGEVHAVEAGPGTSVMPPRAPMPVAGTQPAGVFGTIGIPLLSNTAGLRERGRVSEPTELSVCIGVQAELERRTRERRRSASHTRGSLRRAGAGYRLAVLEGKIQLTLQPPMA